MRKALVAIVLLAHLCGCICSPAIPATKEDVVPNQAEVTSTVPETTLEAPATTLESITSSTVVADDLSQVAVSVPICLHEASNNARVSGYVTNNGRRMLSSVVVRVKLEMEDGSAVSGGLKTIRVDDLSPRESRNFTVAFEKPPNWVRCRAFLPG
jgi:hypothetical protein